MKKKLSMKQRLKVMKTLFDKRVISKNVERFKLPNYSIVKFFFENDILDMLVFLVLRFYSEFKQQEEENEEEPFSS